MSRGRIEELEALLEETQQSLTFALARIEAHRCRERLLLREYETLRAQIAGVGVGAPRPVQPAAQPQQPTQRDAAQPTSGTAALDEAAAAAHGAPDAAPSHLLLTSLDERYPIWLYLSKGKVPGTLLVAGDDLHFVQTHARVSAADYLGIRALKASDDGHLQHSLSGRSLSESAQASSGAADADAAQQHGGTRPTGVLSGAASWFAQRVNRNSGSGDGGSDYGTSSIVPGFTNIFAEPSTTMSGARMTTIMHTLDEDGSSSEETESSWQQPDADSPSEVDASAAPLAPSTTPYRGPGESPELRLWDIAWADEAGQMRRLQFEADLEARAFIHRQVQQWSQTASQGSAGSQSLLPGQQQQQQQRLTLSEASFQGTMPVQQVCGGCQTPLRLKPLPVVPAMDARTVQTRVFSALDLELAVPDLMRPAELPPAMQEQSGIVSGEQARAVAGALPPRFRMSAWSLLYSTERHGISLQTLYRKSVPAPTLLFIRDSSGFVFGAFTSEGWKVATRFYGTGEAFVFQLQPHRAVWRWKRAAATEKNDYFMFGTPESIAVGGGGHFAIFLQSDLLRGSSGISSTFGNPCLAGTSDFKVVQLEVWALR